MAIARRSTAPANLLLAIQIRKEGCQALLVRQVESPTQADSQNGPVTQATADERQQEERQRAEIASRVKR
jgi:hypothetical protein